jgi:hypothetical protein
MRKRSAYQLSPKMTSYGLVQEQSTGDARSLGNYLYEGLSLLCQPVNSQGPECLHKNTVFDAMYCLG